MKLETIRNIYRRHEPKPIGGYRFFSVLVPFVEHEGKLYLLYEVRAKQMESQPGEICFPGGHVEKGEDPMTCALRETEEEIGIPAGRIEVIGQGNTLHGNADFTLYTYLGVICYEDYQNVRIAPDEVDRVFLADVDRLFTMRPEMHTEKMMPVIRDDFPYAKLGIDRDYSWRYGRTEIPIYDLDGQMIWGITGRITRDIMNTIRDEEA